MKKEESKEKTGPENVQKEIKDGLGLENNEIAELKLKIQDLDNIPEETKNELFDLCDRLVEVLEAGYKIGAEPALEKNDSVKEIIDKNVNSTKQKFFTKIGDVKNKVVDAVKNIPSKVKDYKQNVKDGIDSVDKATHEEEVVTTFAAAANTAKGSKWTEKRKDEGRSEFVADGVQSVKEARNNTRARMGRAALKVVGFVGKGAALFGPKGRKLAEKMVKKTGEKTEKFVSKESRIGKILEHVADAGYTTADGVRNVGDKAVEIGGKARDGVKKGALAVGRGAVDTAATITGVSLAAVEIGKAVGKKGKTFAKTKIVDPVKDIGKDVKETARDTKNFGSKLFNLAKNKVSQVRNIPTNLKQRTSNILKSVADRVAPSLDETRASEARNRAVAQSRDEASKAFNTLTGKENSDGDAR